MSSSSLEQKTERRFRRTHRIREEEIRERRFEIIHSFIRSFVRSFVRRAKVGRARQKAPNEEKDFNDERTTRERGALVRARSKREF